jgi:hypothetical protein
MGGTMAQSGLAEKVATGRDDMEFLYILVSRK